MQDSGSHYCLCYYLGVQVSCISAGPSQEVFSFSFGGAGDNLLAAGCKSQVTFVSISF